MPPDGIQDLIVRHSVSDQFGEADLMIEFTSAGQNDRYALLVEDKINAAFGPDQPQRYRQRGELGIDEGRWTQYKTVLVAPGAYLRSSHDFDISLSLESISDWLCPDDPIRRAFKQRRLRLAIDKKNATGVQIVDEVITKFRAWYFDEMSASVIANKSNFIPPPPRTAYWGDTWMEWRSGFLPSRCVFRHVAQSPLKVGSHRMLTGVIELAFKNVSMIELEKLRQHLRPAMTLESTGKYKQHTAIRSKVEPIIDFADLDCARTILSDVLTRAADMQDIVLAHRNMWAGLVDT